MNPENVMVGEPKREVLLRIEWQQLEPLLVAQRPARVVAVVEVQVLEYGMVDVWKHSHLSEKLIVLGANLNKGALSIKLLELLAQVANDHALEGRAKQYPDNSHHILQILRGLSVPVADCCQCLDSPIERIDIVLVVFVWGVQTVPPWVFSGLDLSGIPHAGDQVAGAKDGDEYVNELGLLDIKKVNQPFQNAVVIKRGAFSDSL